MSALLFLMIATGGVASAVFWKRATPDAGEIVWLLRFVAQSLIRMPHVAANRQNTILDRRLTVTERLALPAMFLAMMALPIVDITTPLLAFADYRLPVDSVWIGLCLTLAFIWLFWRSHADLGRNWSPGLEVREEHGLVTVGVYRLIRHPMYAAIWLAAFAQPLLIQNWMAGPPVLAAFLFMWLTRLPQGEGHDARPVRPCLSRLQLAHAADRALHPLIRKPRSVIGDDLNG